jgi:hypothetical protein
MQLRDSVMQSRESIMQFLEVRFAEAVGEMMTKNHKKDRIQVNLISGQFMATVTCLLEQYAYKNKHSVDTSLIEAYDKRMELIYNETIERADCMDPDTVLTADDLM